MYTILGGDSIDFMSWKTVKLLAYNGKQNNSNQTGGKSTW